METMVNVWAVVEHVRVASGAAELAIFTAILYWFFTSSRVADMLEVVGERVGGWCGRDSNSLRQAVRARRRHNDIYTKLDHERTTRTTSLYRVKEGPVVPAPQPATRPPAGLACARCAPVSRESWQDPKAPDTGAVINILDIGQQNFANGGVVSRYLCDLAQCCNLIKYEYKDVVPEVMKDESFQRAIDESAEQEAMNQGAGEAVSPELRRKVEARALKILIDISSAMSNRVLKLVAWLCHKAVRRIAGGGCGTRAACVERLRRAKAAGLPLIFVPLHRSHLDYILVTFTLYLTGLRPPLVAAGDNMRIPFFGWFLRGCGAFFIRRRVDGSEYHGDPLYKTALRSYILNSLAAKNNLEFFIEGGRTRTGKPQPPKAGILSVIMDAYLDGTIDDALLVPVTVNYDRLVDGNFVREQLGMPKQMETFWTALRGIWRTLNTNHGSIRVDFNQPLSLRELVTSFQNYNYLKAPIERTLTPPNNNLAVNLDRQILYNHSHSSMYGSDVSVDHKMMVEAIGRHLVYEKSVIIFSRSVCLHDKTRKDERTIVRHFDYGESESIVANNNLLVNLDRQILYNHSHSSIYGADVSVNHKMMVEAVGRHLVYDAAQATAFMCTNVVSYVLLTEHRAGCSLPQLSRAVAARGAALVRDGRDLGYTGDAPQLLRHALDMLGRSLVRREGSGDKQRVRPQRSIAASLELAYYSNTVVAHYAAPAIVATALESIIRQPNADQEIVRHTELMEASLQLCEILSQEFILCAPCHRIEETMMQALETLIASEVLTAVENNSGLEEQQWSRRFARTLEEEDGEGDGEGEERPDPARHLKYRVSQRPEALQERGRLLRTLRPLLEGYACAGRLVRAGSQKDLIRSALTALTEDYTQHRMHFGEAISTDAIRNCWRLLKQWGVVELYTHEKVRMLRPLPPYDAQARRDAVCENLYKFNMPSPLL